MKIAIPTKDHKVDDHFGHCAYYTIFEVDMKAKKIVSKPEIFPSPQGCGCKSDIAERLKRKGVDMMLAGSMGDGAKMKLMDAGIEIIRGCSGDVDELIDRYINGSVSDSGEACNASDHDGHHECSHSH